MTSANKGSSTSAGKAKGFKVLVVAPKLQQGLALGNALTHVGCQVQSVEGGLYALTMLERDKHHIIISAGHLGDMLGQDLLEIVRGDDAFKHILFVLLDAQTPVSDGADLYTLRLRNDTPSSAIISELRARITKIRDARKEAQSRLSSTGRVQLKSALLPQKHPGNVTVSGTFETLTLYDLAISLTQSQKIGNLFIQLGTQEAVVTFYKGAIVHASLQALVGEEALQAIFLKADGEPSTSFSFEALSTDKLPEQRSIDQATDKLLLSVAVSLDHHRAASA